ncbi:hypothetical protein NG895_24085 [Aeoliella sp. ICT_H6.2]|uniref:Uncharacterized protein n=1 Tax=Aeoliella straminimaris TaxID=2954799 RepID=A0A9X2JIM4_9BACT|nr:hypothetical protein [Aeoliella straminimaris]MCO6046991.1 hypothetical protein [Aeoliella straminimaris]
MSQPEISDQPRSMVVQKPKSNIYTALLGISALALMMACLFLLLEWTVYTDGSFSPFQLWDAASGP